MNKKFIIIANWKCNPETLIEARKLYENTNNIARKFKSGKVVVCSPLVYIPELVRLSRRPIIHMGAQNIFGKDSGAYTGEVGPRMAWSVGARYVIIGHSERREQFGETNHTVGEKVRLALSRGFHAILCVGERSRAGDVTEYTSFIRSEIEDGLEGVPRKHLERLIVAYEPIWAIGSDSADTPENIMEMAIYIRKIIFDIYGKKTAHMFPVLYGGSVNSRNAQSFLEYGGVDGLLIGRVSLKIKEFEKVLSVADNINIGN